MINEFKQYLLLSLIHIYPMTVKIPMNDHLKGYKYYQAVYLGEELERFDAVAEGDFLVFETTHLSQYAILGSNTPFSTSTVQDEEPVSYTHLDVYKRQMLKDGNGGYKALEDPVTSKAVKPAVETEKVKRRKVLITAAFRSEMADEYALNDENGNPRYAVRLHANGGAFEADGTDLLYMKPRSLEFADQELFYVEATCLKPTSSGKVFTGWYRDKALSLIHI